jgi:F1F0 ATPase subunit 2
MDAKRMNCDTATVLFLAAYLTAGCVAGVLYFVCLRWNARRFAERARMDVTIALMLARFSVLAGLLTFAAGVGAMPLLLMALGVVIARFAVMRATAS